MSMKAENHFALLIGVAEYQHINELGGAIERDVEAMYSLLVDPNYCAYPAENVRKLLNTDATNAAIRDLMRWLAESCNEQSVVSIYFSGHGGRSVRGGQVETYLLPVDAKFSSDLQSLESAISGIEFSSLLKNISARKLLVIFDCCHSGGVGVPKSISAPLVKRGMGEEYYKKLAAGQGRAIIASSLDTELSVVLPGDDNSLFTKHLLDGLKGKVRSSDGLIRIFDLFTYVGEKVRQEYSKQSPYIQFAGQDNFPIALYRAGLKEAFIESETVVDNSEIDLFDFDVYVSYLQEPNDNDDLIWVEDNLIPAFINAGLKVASARDMSVLGVSKLDSEKVGLERARRTVVVISKASLDDYWVGFEAMMAQYMGIRVGQYRVVPVYREYIDESARPLHLGMLSGVNLDTTRADKELKRLIDNLGRSLPI